MEKISSLQNQLIKQLVLLKQKSQRQKEQLFLINGWNLLSEALKVGCVVSIFVLDNQNAINQVQTLVKQQEVKIYRVNQAIIDKLSTVKQPQPVMAVCKNLQHQITNQQQVVVLDHLQDPTNLGAILRNMVAFNVDWLVLSHDSVDCYNEKVITASQGAIFKVKFIYTDLTTYLPQLSREGFAIYGTFLHQTPVKSLNQIVFSKKTAIIFGNEGNGINQQWKQLIDDNFVIKTTKHVESLNVAMSVGIVLYCLFTNNIIEFKH